MKIALIGYGKMGKAIEEIAIQQGNEIVLKIGIENIEDFTKENVQQADVAIEFTGPESAFENAKKCIEFGLPVVCGSTGWLDKKTELENLVHQQNGCFLYASNFSVGVNLFFAINTFAAKLMRNYNSYNCSITEIHHTQKKDAPSGTAITIAEQIIENNSIKNSWINAVTNNPQELEIISERIDPAPGTHSIKYSSIIDDIELTHTAHTRTGFASGALVAANFIKNKKGIFTMQDVLGI